MKTNTAVPSYKRHRYPAEILAHTLWLYFRFSLSFRDVEELMAARGVILSYETVRRWTLKFGQQYANEVKRRRPQPGDKWHLDEVFLKINGKQHYLWRRRSAWEHLGYPRAEPSQQRRSRQVLPQAPEGLYARAARPHHRQTGELRSR